MVKINKRECDKCETLENVSTYSKDSESYDLCANCLKENIFYQLGAKKILEDIKYDLNELVEDYEDTYN